MDIKTHGFPDYSCLQSQLNGAQKNSTLVAYNLESVIPEF